MNANRILTRSFHVLYTRYSINVLRNSASVHVSEGSEDIYIGLANSEGIVFHSCFIKIFVETYHGGVAQMGAFVRTRESGLYGRVLSPHVHQALAGKTVVNIWKDVLRIAKDEDQSCFDCTM